MIKIEDIGYRDTYFPDDEEDLLDLPDENAENESEINSDDSDLLDATKPFKDYDEKDKESLKTLLKGLHDRGLGFLQTADGTYVSIEDLFEFPE